jgi:uncharacterized protein YycO
MVTPVAGDFGLVSISGNVGFLIRLGQWINGDGFANYEHAFVYIGTDQIVEAEPGGARIAQLSEYDGREILWSTDLLPLTDDDRNKIIKTAVGFVGTPYSFLDYFLIALYRCSIKLPGVAKRVEDTGHLICSQLVAESDAEAGIKLTPESTWYPPYLITPGKLRKYLLSLAK